MKIKVTKYNGEENVAVIQDEECLKDPVYQGMFDNGVMIVTLKSFLKFQNGLIKV